MYNNSIYKEEVVTMEHKKYTSSNINMKVPRNAPPPIFMKWSSSDISESDPSTYKSYMKDMHKIKGNGVVDTVLQEGQEFINTGISKIEFSRNKKELHIDKISERELIPQTSMNPFLHGTQANNQAVSTNYTSMDNSVYVNDISIQEKFLIPQNSNFYC